MSNLEKQPVIGLVLGDFLLVHEGHKALCRFGASQVDLLIINLYSRPGDEISGERRKQWIEEIMQEMPYAFLVDHFEDTECILPREKDESREDISEVWAKFYEERYKDMPPQVIFSSEKYGDYLANFMNAEHRIFDQPRKQFPTSARVIRQRPHSNWEFIPKEVRPYFVKVITVSGADGGTNYRLCRSLADEYDGICLPETTDRVCAEEVLENAKKFGRKVVFCQGNTWGKSDLDIDLLMVSTPAARQEVATFLTAL